MKRLFFIFCLFLGLGFAASLCAQDDPEIAQEAAALGPKTPALKALLARQGENKDFVLETLHGARDLKAQGLPTEPYLLKANEGLAKGIPTKRILSALKDSRKRTETAAHSSPGETKIYRRPAAQGDEDRGSEASSAEAWDRTPPSNYPLRVKTMTFTPPAQDATGTIPPKGRAQRPR